MTVPLFVKVVCPMPRFPLPWMVCPLPMVSRSPEVLAKIRLFSDCSGYQGRCRPELTFPLKRKSIPFPALAKFSVPLLVNVPTRVCSYCSPESGFRVKVKLLSVAAIDHSDNARSKVR